MAGALPLIVGGINLDSLSQSSPLRVLTAYASTLAALLIAAKTGGSHTLLHQVATWRVGVDGGSLIGGEQPPADGFGWG
jgi:3-deoxy-D-arabino-heptulosonate 7-phosphate (DAHP) synthase class II